MSSERKLRLETAPDLAQGGDAIARAPDGRIVFVQGAAPAEIVEAEIVQSNKSFLRARVLRVLEPSRERVEPACRYFGTCGGCTLQHVDAHTQLRSKQAAVLETLARTGGVDRARHAVDAPWSGDAYGYRSKARFAVGGGALGYRARDSRRIVDVETCPILTAPLQATLTSLRRERGGPEREIDAIATLDRAEVGPENLLFINDEHGPLTLAADVFAQANHLGNHAMVGHVVEACRGTTSILELFAGSGNFTRALRAIAPVHAIEHAGKAVELAKKTLPDVAIEADDVERAVARLVGEGRAFDCLVIDPPRTGMTKPTLEAIAHLHPRILVYVSCDPATFARDVRTLGDHGFELHRVRVFDLYPQTAHVELIGMLKGPNT